MDTSELRFGSVQNLYLELETLPLTELFRSHIEIKRDYEGANPRNHGGALMPWRDVKQESAKKDEL